MLSVNENEKYNKSNHTLLKQKEKPNENLHQPNNQCE